MSKYQSYAQSYDEETARWVLYEEMKHYTRIAFIKTRGYSIDWYRKIAKENAEFLGITYRELDGPLVFSENSSGGPGTEISSFSGRAILSSRKCFWTYEHSPHEICSELVR